ncbi:DeoR/GlpR family DNA-binding transcription regulator [Anaerococcus porci]|uniref:DeoR/GlpR family DNA-binding transcription regulator n=1 Tax=Anaerococcus porci TaxID=2652269 RepID=UPI002A754841|nr:DeoR/GlpR family DNA-binding transcription regulator [Anaerococcus porci]MDY3006706.1 DeoR/GlpR family DNA-binding transcription regulator [Anaerococcus porci]
MKTKKTIVDNRRKDILSYIRENKEINTNDLVNKFNVSDITIRRDLNYLESIGKIERFYGGARLNQKNDSKNILIENKKEKIAKKCSEFITTNDDIFINSSSTALLVLKYIKDKRVNIITNNAKALFLDIDPHVSVTLTGGRISYPKNALTGTFALNNLKSVASDISIIGISGISKDGDLTTSVMDEVEINQYMINESKSKNILVCDSSKFLKQANFKIGSITNIDLVITDNDIDRNTIEQLEKFGIKLIIV